MNRTHNQVERTPRIDSFEIEHDTGWSCLLCGTERGLPVLIDTYHYIDYGPDDETELLEIRQPGWNQAVELSKKMNGFGGYQFFFRCPCGRRVRFLYQSATGFSCRRCSRLNYKSQQQNKASSLYYYSKGLKFLEKHFDSRDDKPDGFEFSHYTPRRLRRQHETTYQRHLKRLQRYQQQHTDMELMELSRILKIFE